MFSFDRTLPCDSGFFQEGLAPGDLEAESWSRYPRDDHSVFAGTGGDPATVLRRRWARSVVRSFRRSSVIAVLLETQPPAMFVKINSPTSRASEEDFQQALVDVEGALLRGGCLETQVATPPVRPVVLQHARRLGG